MNVRLHKRANRDRQRTYRAKLKAAETAKLQAVDEFVLDTTCPVIPHTPTISEPTHFCEVCKEATSSSINFMWLCWKHSSAAYAAVSAPPPEFKAPKAPPVELFSVFDTAGDKNRPPGWPPSLIPILCSPEAAARYRPYEEGLSFQDAEEARMTFSEADGHRYPRAERAAEEARKAVLWQR